MATTNEKILTGFLLVVATLGSVGLTSILNQNKPTYICESKDLISDCINGVKATGTRCYYDLNNTLKYEYCKEGWKPMIKELESVNPVTPSGPSQSAKQYICNQEKCIPI